jgi:hypothetical protein
MTESGPTDGPIKGVSVSLATPLLPAALGISSASQAMYGREELLIAVGASLSMS